MADDLERLLQEARDRIGGASLRAALEEARVALLGRNAELTQRLRGIASLPPEERGPVGKRLNEFRQTIEAMLAERESVVAAKELGEQLERERVDVTLPGAVIPRGGLHLLSQTRREIEDIFIGLGYDIAEGPEIELEYNNFAALNFSDDHPAKAETDTLWIAPGVCLRTHTSPVQARTLRAQEPPIYVIVPGRVYRRDTPDATHSPIFHQVEGLVVDRGITLGDLKGTLAYLARELFGADRETRFRTSFFPFTEPSVEVDVSCFLCGGAGCGVCKHSGWIEILGAGEVDQNVLEMAGLDTSVWQGFAFGMGIERIAFLKYGFPDLRMLYDNDLRFLEQFPLVKVPVSWLRDYVAFDLPLAELAERLVLSGLEVDRIITRGAPDQGSNHGNFRIGRVVEFGKHPNADRLRLCRVDVGEGEPRQIVCGASNFVVGDTVVVALPGAVLPGSPEPLRQAKLRGELSDGMMLSERELQLSDEHDGIIRLPDMYEIGSEAGDHFALEEVVLDLEVTANRGDLMCVYGIAREISTLLDTELAPMPGIAPAATGARPTSDVVRAGIDDFDRCLRFTARAFDGVTVAASPLRIRQRIAAAGMRPISNVVDITNYVMLGIGNPIHAYDAAKIPGNELTARLARPGETIVTLDGKARTLTPDMLVIADAVGPNGLAGIMGGEGSEIAPDTTTVVVEAANFERYGIARTCQALALRTDGAGRWIRGVDPYLAPRASAWTAELLVDLAGGQMLPDDQDVVAQLPQRERIVLRTGFAEQVLGMPIADDEAVRILARLGFEPEPSTDPPGVAATVPTWRLKDTTREIDLVEEVGRIHGLDALPATIPGRTDSGGSLTQAQAVRRRVEDALAGIGVQEAYTLSLVDGELSDLYGLADDDPRRQLIALQNPLSADLAYMRRLLVPSLLRAIRRNRSAGRPDTAVYEIAHLYHAPGGKVSAEALAHEPWTLGLVLSGQLGGSAWTGAGAEADFFTAKGVLQTVCGRLGVPVRLEPVQQPYLHPGRAARILVGADGVRAGEVGELHPTTAARFDLEGRVAVLELDLDLLAAAVPDGFRYAPVPDQPPVLQDIAVVVDDAIAAEQIIAAARTAGAPLLTHVGVFDVYRDERRLGPGKVSLALRLVFQDPERTLTEDEASAVRETVVQALGDRFNAELRS